MLDVATLRARGWRPQPIRDIVLKVHQRCNLACDYCYVYTMADQSWRDRPRLMSRRVWRAAAERIAEHAETHALPTVRLILHGGEPLLAGPRTLARMAADLRAAMPDGCRPELLVQTNGTLLDTTMLDVFAEQGISVGVSLDGTRRDNDRRRRHPDGRGSHDAVDRALAVLGSDRYRSLFAGLLCTVDLDADPVGCYEALLGYAPPTIDFLLPHANWSQPPRRGYGAWLAAAFDRWYGAPVQETGVRLFEDVLSLLLGGHSRSEQVGLSPVSVLVVETDGTVEQVDSLKSAYAGACATGLTVFADPFDRALDHPGVVARQIGVEALSDTCRACPVHQVCGGGHYAHRYSPGTGFRNPSVYCTDLLLLIEHVRQKVTADLGRRLAGSRP